MDDTEPMMQKNPTFRGSEPTWANACVGNNGNPSYVEYSKGFSQAANLLIDQVLNDRGIHLYVDDLVYPICFNMRHSVELRLKGAIDEVIAIANIKNIKLSFNSTGSHDIKIIWNYFRTESEKIDKRYVEINKKIEPTILDIAEVDSTGQTFRYPVSNTAQKHLTDVALINFVVLKRKFNELESNLDGLHRLNHWLNEEYKHGTFTSKLSRAEIFKISRRLPQRAKWATTEFSDLKDTIRIEYGLSNNDFTKAINIIKAHYSLAPLIGEQVPLIGINEQQLSFFIERWINDNQEVKKPFDREPEEISFESESMLTRIISRTNKTQESWSVFSDKVSVEYLAAIKSLFYFARDKGFTEYYIRIYQIHLRESNVSFDGNPSSLRRDFMHIFTKSNAVENILISLYALGHIQLAEEIINHHDLNHSFYWLDDARSGELFSYPDYAGY